MIYHSLINLKLVHTLVPILTLTMIDLLLWSSKRGQKINGEIVYKSRDSLETLINPIAKVIKDISTSDNEIFVDNAELFTYDLDLPTDDFSGFVVNGISTTAVGSVESINNFS